MKSRQKLDASRSQKEFLDEQSPALLKELHLLTRDGALNADARRKLKQVNHLVTLLRPALQELFGRFEKLSIVDLGAGKAYLGFILYELFFKPGDKGEVISIEERDDLMTGAQKMAERLGYGQMRFVHSKIIEAELPARVHLLTALHACDTATDDALIAGIEHGADFIAVVPCCQAEVARLLAEQKGGGAPAELWAHGIHRREFGSHLTNVIRALTLERFGYQVTVTELVGWEHSLKNELILAKRVHKENKKASDRLQALLAEFPVKPKIIRHFA